MDELSNTHPTTEPTPDPQDDPLIDETSEPHETEGREGNPTNPNREAAKYRRKLREAEQVIERQAARIEAVDREQVEQRAGEFLVDPSDIWTVTSLEKVRDDDGNLDGAKLDGEIRQIIETKPHWVRPRSTPQHAGARETVPQTPSIGAALNGLRS